MKKPVFVVTSDAEAQSVIMAMSRAPKGRARLKAGLKQLLDNERQRFQEFESNLDAFLEAAEADVVDPSYDRGQGPR